MQRVPRVVVTAVGAITAQGAGAAALWRGLNAGRVAIRPVRGLDMSGYRTRLGGEVDPTGTHEGDAALRFALAAAREAMADAGIWPAAYAKSPSAVAAHRWGVIVGTCNAGLRSAEHAYRAQLATGTVDWHRYLMIQPQTIAEALAAQFGLHGPVLSVNTACASGAHAIAHAVEMIRRGRVDAMLVGGSDAFCDTVFAGFNSLESLSAAPAAPYSRRRDGLSLGEGAGMLVLTTLPAARAAGAPILAEVLGYGLSADGYHPTAPRPDGGGAARAIAAALADSGVDPHAVDYVNGHGTGTVKNDSAESNAVRRALGTHAEHTPLSSTKSMIGHLLGAAAAVEGIATVLALRDQIAPPTANFTEPDPRCGLDPVAGTARPMRIDVALSNNFAFGGANATVAFGRPGWPAATPATRRLDEVVVTGVGVVHPRATDRRELWRAYRAGTGHGQREHGLRVSYVDLDATAFVTPKQGRRLDRLSLFAVAACRRALDDANLELGSPNGDGVGVIVGTGIGPVESLETFSVPVMQGGAGAANPAVFPNTVYNAAAGHVAMLLGARGPTSTVTAAHAAGAAALCMAADLLAGGHAEALLCVGVDALTPLAVQVYAAIPLFGPRHTQRFLLSEGGIALALERRSTAEARGARVLAVLAGHGIANDAVGIGQCDPAGRGIEHAMRTALDTAGMKVADLAAIWANTTGLAPADRPEQAALTRLLGATTGVPTYRPKLVLGEPVGAGAHQSAALALQHWANAATNGPVLINSASLGGTHICVILRPDKDVTT